MSSKSLFLVECDELKIYVVATTIQTAIHTLNQRLDEVGVTQSRDINQVTRVASGLLGLCGV